MSRKIFVTTPEGEQKAIEIGRYVDLDKEVVLLPNGERLTNALAEQIVERVHEALPGRPSLTSPGTRSPEVKARVPQATKDRLDAEVAKRGTTASVIIREALNAYLKSA